MLCQLCTSVKRYEIFAVTVAYCAVSVVFVNQNNSSNNGSMTAFQAWKQRGVQTYTRDVQGSSLGFLGECG
jgi:hypothetical protein